MILLGASPSVQQGAWSGGGLPWGSLCLGAGACLTASFAALLCAGERLCLANESQEISVEGFIQSIRDHTRGMDSARDEQPYPDSASEDGSLPPPSPQKAGSRTLTMQVDEHAEHGPPLMRALSAQRRRDDSAAPDRVPDVGSSPG